mmetsp:Transcript_70873/g.153933  ORF Transcript_70873/g.153933 Transcript_70873/m.153933 type:complete len:109 (-) Transcript_70873:528-854(-)
MSSHESRRTSPGFITCLSKGGLGRLRIKVSLRQDAHLGEGGRAVGSSLRRARPPDLWGASTLRALRSLPLLLVRDKVVGVEPLRSTVDIDEVLTDQLHILRKVADALP